jgi:hypothetical protein
MMIGTIIALRKKHPYVKFNIYNTGIGFVNKDSVEKYLDYGEKAWLWKDAKKCNDRIVGR